MASDLSRRYRARGNQLYLEGCADALAPIVRSGRLLRASKFYRQALDSSRTEDERAKCSKNLGAVHWKHAVLSLDICDAGKGATLQDRPPSFDIVRSIEYYLAALRHGRASNQRLEWRESIENRLEEIATNIVEGNGWLLAKSEFIGEVCKLFQTGLLSSSKSQAWAIIQLAIAQNHFDQAVKELRLSSDRSSSYRDCLSLLHTCYGPIEEAEKHVKPGFLEAIKTLKTSVDSCRLTCESIQAIDAGKQFLRESVKAKDEDTHHDLVIAALDKFKEAAVIARGVDAECEAEALAAVGDLYKEVFKKDQQAHPYYSLAVYLAQNSDAMQSAKWYRRAKVALNLYFKQKRRSVEPTSDIQPEIKGQVEKIEMEYKKQTTEGFLKFLYAEHPPRVNNGSSTVGDLVNGANTRVALRKAIQQYHPDHNAVGDDERWVALCGEITRLLLDRHRAYQAP